MGAREGGELDEEDVENRTEAAETDEFELDPPPPRALLLEGLGGPARAEAEPVDLAENPLQGVGREPVRGC